MYLEIGCNLGANVQEDIIGNMWNNANNSSMQESTTMNTSSDKATNQNSHNCIPLMIAHINRHGANLKVYNTPVKLAMIMAIVTKMEAVSTKVNFEFKDDTGTISGHKWLDSDQTEYAPNVSINSYAQVYGMPRNHAGENFIIVVNIQPMKHLNELLAHFMEVTFLTLEAGRQNSLPSMKEESNLKDCKTEPSSYTSNSMPTGFPQQAVDLTGLSKEQAIVLQMINNYSSSENGIERNDLKSKVPPYVMPKVDNIVEFLTSEGHIYTTITEDHFKNTSD